MKIKTKRKIKREICALCLVIVAQPIGAIVALAVIWLAGGWR